MFIILIILIFISLYIYGTWNHSYWLKKGVKHRKPLPFFGNSIRIFFEKVNFSQEIAEIYRAYPKEKFVGFYAANEAALILRDPELIKRVLVTDFQCFHDRGFHIIEDTTEPLFRHLLFADGDLWKILRQKLLPAFNPKKMKDIFPLVVERAVKLQKMTERAAERGEVDVKDLIARYTIDFIGACGFGIDMDTLSNQKSIFRQLSKRLFVTTYRDVIVRIMKIVAPQLFKNLHFYDAETENQVLYLIKNVMELRNYEPTDANDFIDLLLRLRKKGKFVEESFIKQKDDGTRELIEVDIDDVLLAAQAYMFFTAGFETSSSATSFTLHQLAFHPKIQRKCQQEVDEVLSRHDNKITYEAVQEMKYLNMALSESLRIWPPVGFLIRKCAAQYTFPGTDVTIGNDVRILIPVHAIHHDEQYFHEPHKFMPDRFHPSNESNIHKSVYLPFGAGFRICIGERLGRMQSLVAMAALLSRFSVAPSENSSRHPAVDASCIIVQGAKDGLPLLFTPRKNL